MSDLNQEGLKVVVEAMHEADRVLDRPITYPELAEAAIHAYLSASRSPRDLEAAERCPTCGQAVELYTGLEGTSSFVKAAEVERDSERAKAERLADFIEGNVKGAQVFRDTGMVVT